MRQVISSFMNHFCSGILILKIYKLFIMNLDTLSISRVMNTNPRQYILQTIHHELGHTQYHQSYEHQPQAIYFINCSSWTWTHSVSSELWTPTTGNIFYKLFIMNLDTLSISRVMNTNHRRVLFTTESFFVFICLNIGA